MKSVTEMELNRAVTLSDVFTGVVAAICAGAVMGAWLYFCLVIGVG